MMHLLTGENTFETERRLKELIAGYDGDVERFDGEGLSVEQLPDLFSGATLFSSKRLVIIKNASQNKSLWSLLADWLEKGIDNDVIFVEEHPDKRTKTYKWLEKNSEVFASKELQPFEAVRWLQQGAEKKHVNISRSDCEFFVDYVGTDQWRLESELEKLALSGSKISEDTIRALVEPTPQATSFELLDAAFRGETAEMERLFQVVSREDDPYMFFGLLSGQIYALALVATGKGMRSDDIAKATGVHPFVLRKISGLAGRMSADSLQQLTSRLAELDANMKSRSIEPWTQVYSFLKSLS
jgi:DNA polymerase-3 subunit delta